MSDLISREAAIDVASYECHEWRGIFGRIKDGINSLPSAEKKGWWNPIDVCEVVVACSECHRKFTFQHNYCPNCGAKMEASE